MFIIIYLRRWTYEYALRVDTFSEWTALGSWQSRSRCLQRLIRTILCRLSTLSMSTAGKDACAQCRGTTKKYLYFIESRRSHSNLKPFTPRLRIVAHKVIGILSRLNRRRRLDGRLWDTSWQFKGNKNQEIWRHYRDIDRLCVSNSFIH